MAEKTQLFVPAGVLKGQPMDARGLVKVFELETGKWIERTAVDASELITRKLATLTEPAPPPAPEPPKTPPPADPTKPPKP